MTTFVSLFSGVGGFDLELTTTRHKPVTSSYAATLNSGGNKGGFRTRTHTHRRCASAAQVQP